jgi:phosphatidylinositol kinase/protein kinase (PI-3  family)
MAAQTAFQVVPMLPDLGMLEWVSGTHTIKSCIEKDANAKQGWKKAYDGHVKWISKFGTKGQSINNEVAVEDSRMYVGYYDAFANIDSEKGRKHLDSLHELMKGDVLRSYVQNMCATTEGFLAVRQQIAQDLSTMSMASYILGIGDRHLDNLLLSVQR